MLKRVLILVALAAAIALAIHLRSPNLAQRPLHNDEAVNTVKFQNVLETGRFEYDPHEYHGPTLYYLTYPSLWITKTRNWIDTTEPMYRGVTVACGIAIILLSLGLGRGLGWGALIWAALFTAVSPAMVFYSRYYIHEPLLVFFSLLAIVFGYRYFRSGSWIWAILTGGAVGCMFATKETWVLHIAAAAVAIAATWGWNKLIRPDSAPMKPRLWPVAAAILVCLIVAMAWFLDGFRPAPKLDANGKPVNAMTYFGDKAWRPFAAYTTYFDRGSGNSDHDHPRDWYLQILWHGQPIPKNANLNVIPRFTEMVVMLLAGAGIVMSLLMRRSAWSLVSNHEDESKSKPGGADLTLIRFLGFYTVALTAVYSLVPYKTPWCVLSFLHGILLLAGFAAAQIVTAVSWACQLDLPQQCRKTRAALAGIGCVLMVTALGAAVWHSCKQNEKAVASLWLTDERFNPWIYHHTSSGLFQGLDKIEKIASLFPQARPVHIQIVTRDCWPLPWYLRKFDRAAFFPELPQVVNADVLIGPQSVLDQIQQRDQAAQETLPAYVQLWPRPAPPPRYFVVDHFNLRYRWLMSIMVNKATLERIEAQRREAGMKR